jgi:hypothetical protein
MNNKSTRFFPHRLTFLHFSAHFTLPGDTWLDDAGFFHPAGRLCDT